MKITYGKELTGDEINVVKNIADSCGILFDTAKLLFFRGIDTPEKAIEYLNPSKKGFLNPFDLKGISESVERITRAKNSGEKVCIFGDYDADGICASVVTYNSLLKYGIKADIIIPEREEGYGLNVDKVLKLSSEKNVTLLITVDCGISEYEKIEVLKKNGIDVIVTDHHEPPQVLPDCICVNPKISGSKYSFSGLCGAGVAFKLASALIGKDANENLDFVALATVADSMDLISENRCIVHEGLKCFSQRQIRPCFKYLLGENAKQITSQTLAFSLAPRINAGGRMGDANSALNLFLATDEKDIFDLSVKLNSYNTARQAECDVIYKLAKEKIVKSGIYKRNAILVYDKSWKVGFIGIVAARLVEDYNRPVIVFAGSGDALKGSARSIEGINIFEAISSAASFTVGFGGHSQAAGVTLGEDKFDAFYDAIDEYIKNKLSVSDFESEIYSDWEITSPVSVRFAKEIDSMEPFGTGNKRPCFTISADVINSLPIKIGSPHYGFKSDFIEMLDFYGEKNVLNLSLPLKKKILFEINYSVYKGYESVKGYVKKVIPEFSDVERLSLYTFKNDLVKDAEHDFPFAHPINKNQIHVKEGFGTLYVISDPKNLSQYQSKNTISIFEPKESGVNCVCISPRYIPECYEKVIYLDKPYAYLSTKAEMYVCKDLSARKVFFNLDCDRSAFAETYNVLKTLQKRPFTDSVDFYYANASDLNGFQFVFCLEVFLELEIFTVKNGVLYLDTSVKRELNSSKIYGAIRTLKGEL